MRIVGLLGGLLSLLLTVSAASSTTLVDTIDQVYGESASFYALNHQGGLGQSVALPFSSGTSTSITDITAFVGFGTGVATLGIMSTVSGLPTGSFFFRRLFRLTDLVPLISLASRCCFRWIQWGVGPIPAAFDYLCFHRPFDLHLECRHRRPARGARNCQCRPRTLNMGDDASLLRWDWLHGLSSEVKASIDGRLIHDHRV